MHKIAKFINRYFLTGLLALMLIITISSYSGATYHDNTNVSYEEIEKANPIIILDQYSLRSEENMGKDLLDFENFINKHIMVMQRFNINLLENQTIPIMINSSGGSVRVGKKLINFMLDLKHKYKFKVRCHIKKAYSMAFTVAITLCDHRIGMKDVDLMQHPVYNRIGNRRVKSLSSKSLDIEICRMESDFLNVKYEDWFKISKTNDHYFTKEEMTKYNLIHEFQ